MPNKKSKQVNIAPSTSDGESIGVRTGAAKVDLSLAPAQQGTTQIPTIASAPALPPSLQKKVFDITTPSASSDKPLSKSASLAQRMKGVNATYEPLPALTPTPLPAPPRAPKEPIIEPEPPITPTMSILPDSPEVGPIRLDDAVSDAAVDEITAADADKVLEIEDSSAAHRPLLTTDKRSGIGWIFKRKLTWFVIIVLLLVVAAIVPFTQYRLLGLIMSKTITIQVNDASTHAPISDASIMIAGKHLKTSAAGTARVYLPVGFDTATVMKQYYYSTTSKATIRPQNQRAPTVITMHASGRQVPFAIDNTITSQPIAGAEVSVSGTTARTNANGQGTVVLPTHQASYAVHISATGYDDFDSTIRVVGSLIAANTYHISPSGTVYYLTDSADSVNVSGASLTGANKHVVLAGTGSEVASKTRLFTSSDQEYLMLYAKRSPTANAGLYLIKPSANNDVTTVEQDGNTITPIGWSGHYFIYELTTSSVAAYQSGEYSLKSYNADSGQTITLDQSAALGTQPNYANQIFANFYIYNTKLFYTKLWQGDVDTYATNNVSSSIDSISVTGQNIEPYEQFPMSATGSNVTSLAAHPYAVGKYYFEAQFSAGNNQYFSYVANNFSQVDISSGEFADSYYTGKVSPNGASVASGAIRDGKFVLSIGSVGSSITHSIASLSTSYSLYGWFNNGYLILSSTNDTLSIVPVSGLSGTTQPTLIGSYLPTT